MGGNKVQKTASPKERDLTDSSENVAAGFAALLSGSMKPSTDLKGQNSKISQNGEEKQSADHPLQNTQNPNGMVGVLGYGTMVLPLLAQSTLQSDRSAGKEENFGNDASNSALVNGVPLSTTAVAMSMGMTASTSNGDTSKIAELDKYRQVIGELLDSLSGEITAVSPKETALASESSGTNSVSQDMAKVVQGWTTVLSDIDQERSETSGQAIPLNSSATEGLNVSEVLSGTMPSAKGNSLSGESAGGNSLSQDTDKVLQDWSSVLGDVAQERPGTSGQATPLNSSATNGLNFSEALSGKMPSAKGNSQSGEDPGANSLSQNVGKGVQLRTMVTGDEVAREGSVTSSQATSLNSSETKGRNYSESLSGKMPSAKENFLSIESVGANSLSQAMVKDVRGQAIVTGSSLLETLSPQLSLGGEGVKGGKASQRIRQTIPTEIGQSDSLAEGSKDPLLKQAQGNELNSEAARPKNVAFQATLQQQAEEMGPTETKTAKLLQGVGGHEVLKAESEKISELSGNDVQNLNASVGVGVVSNPTAVNGADGKTVAVPVWEQISTVIRGQVLNKAQDLKQLDIQLHPADLGKIQIDLRWENGQVHLEVQASQAATGQLLQNQLPDLRQALANQGVNCGMLQMGQGGAGQHNSHGESRRTLSQNAPNNDEEDIITGTIPLFSGEEGTNRINVTA
ncbi:putative Flagellar hook-length control family protein [Candidatus Desulfosporosinus infrequens]|uniref:Putative Flagellar hook-length control family protein n=1 Tax=Candidatus Desulfosporosinus infrequens TaxID=2043169 RepID=A0A2U3LUY7_9FIRM|nr:putative Flagellar hook-length control family protein [Candidatus Desulfosporosinus infrequens]